MLDRSPDFSGALPWVTRRPAGSSSNTPIPDEVFGGNNVLQLKTAVTRPVPLADCPGVDIEKIERRKGLVPDRRQGNPPYDVEEYIRRRIEVD